MKHILAILIATVMAAFAMPAFAQDAKRPELTPEQKLKAALVLGEAATALVVGPIFLPAAIITGKTEGLCHLLEGNKKPSSYNPNPDGKDQCPNGNWLRVIPYLGDIK